MDPQRRPNIKLPLEMWERVVEFVAFLLIAASVIHVITHYSALPAKVPTHFGASGQPNSWGPKWMVWLLPGLGAVMFVSLSLASRISFRWFNIPWKITEDNAEVQYLLARRLILAMNPLCMVLLGVLTWHSVALARGLPSPIAGWMFGAIVVAFAGTIVLYFVLALRAR